METNVIMEELALELESSDYNGRDVREITWTELRNSNVGDVFIVDRASGCGRDVHEESAKVVYKDDKGCAVLIDCYRTSDEPDPKEWDEEPILYWFQYRK